MFRKSFVFSLLTAGLALPGASQTADAPEKRVTVTIDAAKTGEPITKYIYGQFIEHLGDLINRGLWAEMLDDRKFFFDVNSKPDTASPAFFARLRASANRLTISRSTWSARSAGTETCCFRLLAKTFRRAAAATAARVASTQTPRPGRRRARSGTIVPSGPSTKRMRSSGAFCARDTAHKRSGPLAAAAFS